MIANKARRVAARVSCLMLVVLLGGCATRPVVWQKKDIQADQINTDLARCASYADHEAGRELDQQQNFGNNPGFGGQSTYDSNMATFMGGKNRDRLLARCMKLKGYRQADN